MSPRWSMRQAARSARARPRTLSVFRLGDEKGNDPYNVLSRQDNVEAGHRQGKLASD